jgi:hypothetical protein
MLLIKKYEVKPKNVLCAKDGTKTLHIRFFTMLITACHWSLPWDKRIQNK